MCLNGLFISFQFAGYHVTVMLHQQAQRKQRKNKRSKTIRDKLDKNNAKKDHGKAAFPYRGSVDYSVFKN